MGEQSNQSSRHDDLYGCINLGMGSKIWRDHNWRCLEQHRENPLHQLFGAVGLHKPERENLTILLWIDNKSVVAYINYMEGTHSSQLANLAIQLWSLALKKGIFLMAKHIAGKDNVSADWMSCAHRDRTDWMLNQEVFQEINQLWGPLKVDLFATRLSTQL